MANETQTNYDEMTVIELKEEARKRNVEFEADSRKDDLIKALEKDDKSSAKPDSKATAKGATATDKDPGDVRGHLTIKGSESADTRLFQTSPYVKEWLTKAEAEKLGHYWRDEEKLGKA